MAVDIGRQHYGRDRRRRPTKADLQALYARSDGFCQECGGELGADWHAAHLAAYSHGGATVPDQMQAWCRDCNLRFGPQDAEQIEGLVLRQWQAQGLRPILEQLWATGAATLHAGPGAGKTLFTAAVFQRFYDAGWAHRILVFVPNRGLVNQTVEAFGRIGIHLDSRPRDGVIEHPDTVGAVVCYQSLNERSAEAHAARIAQVPTFIVPDEVHHLAESRAWAKAFQSVAGDVARGEVHAAGVLNSTGTLFRSNKAQRISTVRYERVETDEGERWQAIADFSVPTSDLIGIELRAPDLYVYGGQATLIDLRDEKVVTGDIADLSQPERNAVMRVGYKDEGWLLGYCAEAIRLLKMQLLAVNYEVALKLLYIANGMGEARLAADALNQAAGQDFARLVISDEPKALKTLERAKRERHPVAIVAVQMVAEGCDCPELSTLAYASNKTAPLAIAQIIARVMRVTVLERAAGRMLPAQILTPDNPELRKAFASALVSALHVVEDDEQRCRRCGRLLAECICPPPPPPPPRLKRWEVVDLENPLLRSATVLTQEDGEVLSEELSHYIEQCSGIGIPETYAPRVAVVSRRGRPVVRTYTRQAPQERPANPRSVNLAHRAALKTAASWMAGYHIGHDDRYASIEVFQAMANDAGNIPKGGRDHATTQQLAAVAEWMIARVREHCATHSEKLPGWAGGEDS